MSSQPAADIAEYIKKGHTISAVPSMWIAGHAYLERELLEMLDRAKEGLESDSPLKQQQVLKEITKYLDEWNR